jgi:two-component system chemotaxis response regulator CheB
MPVVMLSSLTQSGAATTLRAYELGAVECFPKPLKVSPEQFAKNVSKLARSCWRPPTATCAKNGPTT